MADPRVVCISGCSSGLGLALAEQCVARGDVVYAGLRDLADRSRLPSAARALRLDVTNADDIAAALATVEREFGRLDVLINNAGTCVEGPWELVPSAMLRKVFDINFFGAVELTQAMLPLLRRHSGGSIVMISSLSGIVSLPTDGAYSASKFALEAFAESLSYEVKRWNIRVVVINPGGYSTELLSKAWRPNADAFGVYRELMQHLPSKRGSGKPKDAATAILAAIDDRTGPLHYSLDDVGRYVFRTLGIDDASQREALVRKASGLAWWIDGTPPAASEDREY